MEIAMIVMRILCVGVMWLASGIIIVGHTWSAPSTLSETQLDTITAGVFTSLDPYSIPVHSNVIYDANGNYYVRQLNGLYIENGDVSKVWVPLVLYYYPPDAELNVGIAIGVLRNEATTEMRDGGFQPRLGAIVSGVPILIVAPPAPM